MFNAQQQKLRETDDVKIVRTFECSPFIYGADSKQRSENPQYHPPIGLTESGKFVDVEGRTIPLAQVPEYIKAQSKPPKAAPPPEPKEITLESAMQDAMTPVAKEKPARRAAAKRGRK